MSSCGALAQCGRDGPFFCCEETASCYKPPPAASRPDLRPCPTKPPSRAKADGKAGVAELVDALDLGSSDESCGGSSPSARTKRSHQAFARRISGEPASVGSPNQLAQGRFGRASITLKT